MISPETLHTLRLAHSITGDPYVVELCDELIAARARIAELERDASRYRFVRSNSPDFNGAPVVAVLLSAGLYWLTASEADKRIDAAISRLGGQTT